MPASHWNQRSEANSFVLVLVLSEAVLVIEVDGQASSDSFAIPVAVAKSLSK